ncbi:hypothetical protein WJX72_005931 [[Myrmecia] bisecta]|uniref:ubiquitinyl hydrolase 1 n=1 Tax=[Myrmecia] bisecta TaxID=41462 RepID=A0AAW1P530_9CHLO
MKKGRGAGNKRARTEQLSEDEVEELRKQLEQGQALDQPQILRYLKADQQCHISNCKGKKDNPNCLCGLVPAVGSFRKKGLWRKQSVALGALGPDPSTTRRQDVHVPCGLNNLGNTCYVNSALQCLFMIPSFRQGIYNLDAGLADLPVLQHIRSLFLELQYGPRASSDPSKLASVLNLDNSIQQDGQEFLKLLLSLLESKLQASTLPALQHLVPSLFRGAYVYETVCKACGRASAGSQRLTDFYELDVRVQGTPSLEISLASLLEQEELVGENQYMCSFCQQKQDATRQLCLKAVPPYLCFSLQRFVFDAKKMMKVKATDKLSFPQSLDLAAFAPPQQLHGGDTLMYDLVAILIHKGSSASHGHYVAHVKDEEDGKWWRFDDETVTAMPAGPSGEHADHGVAAAASSAGVAPPAKKAAAPRKGGKRFKLEHSPEVENGNDVVLVDTDSSPEAAASSSTGPIISGNAYMLMYRSRSWEPTTRPPARSSTPDSLPEGLLERVQALQADFDAQCETYQARVEEMQSQVGQRQDMVRNVLQEAAVPSTSEDSRWIAASWLQTWADADVEPGPMDNSVLLCSHQAADPSKVCDMKRISVVAWTQLAELRRGGPELPVSATCATCMLAAMEAQAGAREDSALRESMLAVLAAEEEQEPSSGVYVSKTWLQAWKRRDGRHTGRASPTAAITCLHGGLAPEAAGLKAKRALVPPTVWDYLVESWGRHCQHERSKARAPQADEAGDDGDVVMLDQAGEPDASGHAETGSPAAEAVAGDGDARLHKFTAGTSECAICSEQLAANAETGKDLRAQADRDRAALAQLAASSGTYLEPGSTVFLAPKAWLAQWRGYINALPKRNTSPTAPAPQPMPPLREAIQQLLCPCHRATHPPKLAYPAPAIYKRRGKWVQQDDPDCAFEVVQQQDWDMLQALYGQEGEGNSSAPSLAAMFEVREEAVASAEPLGGSLEDEAVIGADLQPLQHARGGRGGVEEVASLQPQLEVCQDSVAERGAAVRAALLSYQAAEVMVEVVKQEDLQDPSTSAAGERKSRRARKGRAPLQVSSTMTLHALKLALVEALGVHPLNAAVYIKRCPPGRTECWEELDADEATLADCAVFPDEELRVVNRGLVDDDDLSSLFDGGSNPSKRQMERGFAGTALTGGDVANNIEHQAQG